MEKTNELLTYGVMLDLLVVACVQLVRMLTDSFTGSAKSGPIASLPQPYWNGPYQKLDVISDNFIALEINMLYTNVCILYIQYT